MKIRASSQKGDGGKRSEKFLIVFAAMFVPLQFEDGEWKTFFRYQAARRIFIPKGNEFKLQSETSSCAVAAPRRKGG
jgi:hypothetical protein